MNVHKLKQGGVYWCTVNVLSPAVPIHTGPLQVSLFLDLSTVVL